MRKFYFSEASFFGGITDHLTGLAADIIVPGRNPLDVARFISSQNLGYKQLINEHDRWVHIASPGPDTMPRRQELTIWHNGQQNLTTEGLHSVTELRELALRG